MRGCGKLGFPARCTWHFQSKALERARRKATMLMRTIVALAAVLALGSSNGWADAHKLHRHHHHAYIVQYEPDIAAWGPNGGPPVFPPPSNTQCNPNDRSSPRVPSDKPDWVYEK